MKSRVSIIVPVYNIESYIGDCIKSLITQSYINLEILLINDGSKDSSLNICNTYSKIDSRIKVINKENGGLSSARNCGLEHANGDYILFVDGDDQLNKYAVEMLMSICDENNHSIDFVQFKYKEIFDLRDINHEEVEKNLEYRLESDQEKMFDYLYLIGGEAVSSCTKLYKKSMFDIIRFKEGILHEDEYIISDIICNTSVCAYANLSLYYYIMRDGSITHSVYSQRKKEVFFSIDKRLLCFEEKGYEMLLVKEYTKYFVILVLLYASAKKSKFDLDCKEIKERMELMLKKTVFIKSSKKMNLLYKLCKINICFLDLYCILKSMG